MDKTASEWSDNAVTQEAMKVIANGLLLVETTRDILTAGNADIIAAQVIRREDLSIEAMFLLSRILFILTVTPRPSIMELVNKHHVVDSLQKSITRYTKEMKAASPALLLAPISPLSVLTEQLKLIFNLMVYYRQRDPTAIDTSADPQIDTIAASFAPLISPLVQIITTIPIPKPIPIATPHSHAIHALINFPILPYQSQFVQHNNAGKIPLLDRLLDLLDSSLKLYKSSLLEKQTFAKGTTPLSDNELQETTSPLVVLLTNLAIQDNEVREYILVQVIPESLDRSAPLEKADNLTGRCVRILHSSMSTLKDGMGELLFALCGSDANKLVAAIGYGNAAGFLLAKNILFPPPPADEHGTSVSADSRPINPITGQYIDPAAKSDLPEMTDEEKEAEAERLFVLFDRLNRTGVMKTVDPRQKAVQEGRFTEIEENIDKQDAEKAKAEDAKDEEDAGKAIKEWKSWLKWGQGKSGSTSGTKSGSRSTSPGGKS